MPFLIVDIAQFTYIAADSCYICEYRNVIPHYLCECKERGKKCTLSLFHGKRDSSTKIMCIDPVSLSLARNLFFSYTKMTDEPFTLTKTTKINGFIYYLFQHDVKDYRLTVTGSLSGEPYNVFHDMKVGEGLTIREPINFEAHYRPEASIEDQLCDYRNKDKCADCIDADKFLRTYDFAIHKGWMF